MGNFAVEKFIVMEENQVPSSELENDPPKTYKSRIPIFVAIAIILVGIIMFFFWQNRQLKSEQMRKEQEISDTYLKLDSVSNELDQRILTIQELGGDIDTLVALKEQLENDKKSLLIRGENQKNQIKKLNNRVSGYRELLVLKDQEIEQLREVNGQLSEENTTLKVENNQLNVSIQKLQENTEELDRKVAVAARLEIDDLKVFAVNANGKEREGKFRNRHINKLKIQFTVLDNQIAPIEGKELLLRVVAPDGNVLFDVTRGSGSFTFEGRELFFTAKKEILYEKNSQLVAYLYDKGSDYASGQHKIEVYTDGYLMGTKSFMVK